MISISTDNLSFRVGADEIIAGVSFSLEDGDHLGIIGVNGSGKSTLLKMIYGEYDHDEGNVYIAKDKTICMLHQDDSFNVITHIDNIPIGDSMIEQMYATFDNLIRLESKISEYENKLSLDLSSHDATWMSNEYARLNAEYISNGGNSYKNKCRSILIKLGFPEEMHSMPIGKLSGGQRTKLALAKLLSKEPDILLLDEPTNHLDLDTMAWLEEHLSNYSKTLIVVSHDRYFLDKVTNKTLDIENGRATLYKCSYTEYTKQKAANRAAQEKKYEIQQKEIARLEAYIAQQRAWNRERNIIAAESREKAIARMEKVEKPKEAPRSIRFQFTNSGESGNDVLEIKNLTMGFGDKVLFQNANFLVKKHDRFFISGKNGCGKSTLIKILLGQLPPKSGKVEVGYNVEIGYYDQENQNLSPEKTVLDELWDTYPNITQTEIRNTLALFNFKGEDILKKVSILSGGERARLTLAKLILSKMNLLILDEPTNHLDIGSREALETALTNFDGTIIAVSHDRYFTKKLANKFFDISPDVCTLINGNYDDYLSFKSKTTNSNTNVASIKNDVVDISANKEQYLNNKQEQANIRKKKSRLSKIEEEIPRLEKRLSEILIELEGDAGRDYVKAAQLEDERISTEDILMNLYEEEETLTAELTNL